MEMVNLLPSALKVCVIVCSHFVMFFFWGPLISNCLCATFCSNLNLSSMKATYNT